PRSGQPLIEDVPPSPPPVESSPTPTSSFVDDRSGLPPQPASSPLPYREMNEDQTYDFLDRGARHIADLMGNRGASFDKETLGYIKQYVDIYAKRVGTKRTDLWGEDLNFMFGRATEYAPQIIAAFRKENVPPVVGLYIPMIESEYRKCLPSPAG